MTNRVRPPGQKADDQIRNACHPLIIASGETILVQKLHYDRVSKYKWYMRKSGIPYANIAVPFKAGTKTDLSSKPRKARSSKGTIFPVRNLQVPLTRFIYDITNQVQVEIKLGWEPALYVFHNETLPIFPDKTWEVGSKFNASYTSRYKNVLINTSEDALKRPTEVYAWDDKTGQQIASLSIEDYITKERLGIREHEAIKSALLALEFRAAKEHDKYMFAMYGTDAEVNFLSTLGV